MTASAEAVLHAEIARLRGEVGRLEAAVAEAEASAGLWADLASLRLLGVRPEVWSDEAAELVRRGLAWAREDEAAAAAAREGGQDG